MTTTETTHRSEYEAINAAAAKIARGATKDAVYDVLGSAEDNIRDGTRYESEEYCADFMANVRCNLCDGVGGDRAAKWFIKNGVRF